jgi:hypothetical protein
VITSQLSEAIIFFANAAIAASRGSDNRSHLNLSLLRALRKAASVGGLLSFLGGMAIALAAFWIGTSASGSCRVHRISV